MADVGALTARQRRFLAAVATSGTVREAARKAGIGERTAWRYLARPEVREALAASQDAVLAVATRGLAEDMQLARLVLRAVMLDKGTAPAVRVSAARGILDAGLRYAELVTLVERVARLEERMVDDGER